MTTVDTTSQCSAIGMHQDDELQYLWLQFVTDMDRSPLVMELRNVERVVTMLNKLGVSCKFMIGSLLQVCVAHPVQGRQLVTDRRLQVEVGSGLMRNLADQVSSFELPPCESGTLTNTHQIVRPAP